ncbi:MAG: 1,4-dihydroxy-2-naphthoate polyprenyltransferase [Saprospirales bacterium]|nr:MAG: 1,4-dihydroxy-2-naphthoate polyprenyltransferase [Saprospirales bacterium]
MSELKSWIEAARLRTLPLAISTPLTGSFLALSAGSFSLSVMFLAIFTTLLLQILSNLANDYGDFVSGADNENRIGPRRAVQSGLISPVEMKTGIRLTAIVALVSGISLIFIGESSTDALMIIVFLLLGIGALIAAIKYTVGENPYGYKGLGDVFVFLFFGWIGVLGTQFLHSGVFIPLHLLPATSIGLLCAGVLNLNNLRDYESDKEAGKNTLVVFLGPERARFYHLTLLSLALLTTLTFTLLDYQSPIQLLFLITLPFFFQNLRSVFTYRESLDLYPELKKLAMTTLLFSITFGLGLII